MVTYAYYDPYIMTGTGGDLVVPDNVSDPTLVSGQKWFRYEAPFDGALVMTTTAQSTPMPWHWYVEDTTTSETVDDVPVSDELGLLLSAGESVDIEVYDSESDDTELDLSTAQFYTDSLGNLTGFYDETTGTLLANNDTGEPADFYFPAHLFPIDNGQIYNLTVTFTDATLAEPGGTHLELRCAASNEQADYALVAADPTAYVDANDSTTTATGFYVAPGNANYDAAVTAGNTALYLRIAPGAQVTRISFYRLNPYVADQGFSIHWSFASRTAPQLVATIERPIVLETPGALPVNVSNGAANDALTFSVFGAATVTDFDSTTLGDLGTLESYPVFLPAIPAGAYTLRIESAASGSVDLAFTVSDEPLAYDGGGATFLPPTAPVVRWTFTDALDDTITWTLQRNPRSWSSMFPPNNYTHDKTTAPDGKFLTWEAGSRPWRMEFAGYIDDPDEYARFVIWTSKRRRLWLTDHRNRAWLVTLEAFDAQARIEPNKLWAHDYTVRTLIFKQGTD